jgi:membrane fusion protein (multidrug efflux system)
MMTKRMTVMLIIVGIVFGGVAAFQLFRSYMIKKFLASMGNQPQTVSTMVAKSEDWMPALKAVGTLRAVRGTDIAPQVPGVVAAIPFKSSEEVKKGDLLLQLDDTDDAAKLRALKASAELARLTYNRTRQLAQKGTVSQAALDSATASLRSIEAQVAEQQALVAKKRISAPFAGSIGIRLVDVGQYVTPGQKITTLQTLDPIYMDFSLPQQNLQQIKMGQKVSVVTDTFPDLSFDGEITGLDPKVDPQTRNVSVRAQVANPDHKLLPGMFATASISIGTPRSFVTLPQTAITYNPYGETVFLVKEGPAGNDGKPTLIADQVFVVTGDTRGDQVAVVKGIEEGATVVTVGQIKLKNGTPLEINNEVKMPNNPAPRPQDQ